MKQVFFALILLNLAVFVWLAGEDPEVVKGRVQTHDKGTEKLVLLDEYRAEKLRLAKLKAEKAAQEKARVEAEKRARIEAREKAAAEAARRKAAKLKAEQEAAKKKAEQQAAEAAARKKAEQLKAEQEAAKKKAEQQAAEAAARKKAEQLKAEQEAAKKKAEQQQAAATAVGKKTPAAVATNNCYFVGPFSRKGATAELAGQLRLLGVSKTLEIERKVNDPRYWILVSPVKDRKTAREMIAAMKAKGVRDVQLLYNGGKYTVSLGLFQRKEIADLRLKNLTRLGFKPRVSRQDRTLVRFWLAMPEPSPAWTEAQWKQLLANRKNLGYEAGACPPGLSQAAATP